MGMAKTGKLFAMTATGFFLPLAGFKFGQFLARTKGIGSEEMALILREKRRQTIKFFFLQDFDIKTIDEIRTMIASRSKE